MKNQYVCDINDFHKYAILRELAAVHPARLMICWMLTPDDGRGDGSQLRYLRRPERFRPIDPSLFDTMVALVRDGRRNVASVQNAQLLPGASYFEPVVTDGPSARRAYFEGLWSRLRRDDLVFFDPDNGLEVASVPKQRRGSSKYLYWDEFRRAVEEGRSVCVYQHFPRVERSRFTCGLLRRASALTPDHRVFAVYSSRVAHLVAANPAHAEPLMRASRAVVERFGGDLRLVSL